MPFFSLPPHRGDLSPLLPPESRNNYRCLRYHRERRDSIHTRRIVPCSPTWGGILSLFSPKKESIYGGTNYTPVRYPLTKSPPPRKEGGILLLLSSLIHSPVCICGTDRSRFPTKTGRERGGGNIMAGLAGKGKRRRRVMARIFCIAFRVYKGRRGESRF